MSAKTIIKNTANRIPYFFRRLLILPYNTISTLSDSFLTSFRTGVFSMRRNTLKGLIVDLTVSLPDALISSTLLEIRILMKIIRTKLNQTIKNKAMSSNSKVPMSISICALFYCR